MIPMFFDLSSPEKISPAIVVFIEYIRFEPMTLNPYRRKKREYDGATMLPMMEIVHRTTPEFWMCVGLYLTAINANERAVKMPKVELRAIIWLTSAIDLPNVWAISMRRRLTIRATAWAALLIRVRERTLERMFSFIYTISCIVYCN